MTATLLRAAMAAWFAFVVVWLVSLCWWAVLFVAVFAVTFPHIKVTKVSA